MAGRSNPRDSRIPEFQMKVYVEISEPKKVDPMSFLLKLNSPTERISGWVFGSLGERNSEGILDGGMIFCEKHHRFFLVFERLFERAGLVSF